MIRKTFVVVLTAISCSAMAEHFTLRMGSGEKEISQYVVNGMNTFANGDLSQLVDFSSVAPGVIAADAKLAAEIVKYRKRMQDTCEKGRSAGLEICITTDEVKFPAPIWELLRNKAPDPKNKDRIDLGNEAFWSFYRAKYREALKHLPEVKYVMIRTGENYAKLSKTYVGQTIRNRTLDDTYYRDMTRLINETRRLVVDEGKRTLIWRTWDLGNEGFHANTRVYDRILSGVTNRTGLIFAIKHVQTDYWMYNDFNPCIGRGGVQQLVEFQSSREYEGKGAFPNYVGEEHGNDIRLALSKGVKGIWCWGPMVGGWGGPFSKNDRWTRLNIYATMELAHHPEKDARSVAGQWAAREFGEKAKEGVVMALMKSRECVQKLFYIEPYAQKHRGWLSSRNLMRDDLIRGDKDLRKAQGGIGVMYEEVKGDLETALKEKSEAMALADDMRARFEKQKANIVAEKGEKVYDEALTGFIYLQQLSRVVGHYVRGMFLFYKWQETRTDLDASAAKKELTAWKAAWESYQKEIPALPAAPTLYRSQCEQESGTEEGAMADTCERALQALATF